MPVDTGTSNIKVSAQSHVGINKHNQTIKSIQQQPNPCAKINPYRSIQIKHMKGKNPKMNMAISESRKHTCNKMFISTKSKIKTDNKWSSIWWPRIEKAKGDGSKSTNVRQTNKLSNYFPFHAKSNHSLSFPIPDSLRNQTQNEFSRTKCWNEVEKHHRRIIKAAEHLNWRENTSKLDESKSIEAEASRSWAVPRGWSRLGVREIPRWEEGEKWRRRKRIPAFWPSMGLRSSLLALMWSVQIPSLSPFITEMPFYLSYPITLEDVACFRWPGLLRWLNW